MLGVSFKISLACTATCMPFQYSVFNAKNEWPGISILDTHVLKIHILL